MREKPITLGEGAPAQTEGEVRRQADKRSTSVAAARWRAIFSQVREARPRH